MYTEDITIVGQSYRTGLSLNGQYPPVHPFGDCPRQFATGGLAELNAILAIDFSPAFELILAGAELLHWYSRALLSVAPRCQATNSWLSKSPVLPVARPTPPTWYLRGELPQFGAIMEVDKAAKNVTAKRFVGGAWFLY